jgi:hypothetical protein
VSHRLGALVRNRGRPSQATQKPAPPTDKGFSLPSSVPLTSSFLVLRLNCLHQDARSRFDGGEVAIPSWFPEGGRGWIGSVPGCDLPVTIMSRVFEKCELAGGLSGLLFERVTLG